MRNYLTRDGDMLDDILFRLYGHHDIEPVLEVNPGLADYGPILPAGITVHLPEVKATTPASTLVRLWD